MTKVKNGAMHLASQRDGRQIYLDGGLIDDHTEHPAFRNAVRSAAHLYDFQASPEKLEHMTFVSPRTSARVSRMWQIPTSLAALVERRKALVSWAALSCGMLGRSPDHVASALSGLYMGLDQFDAYDRRRAAALREYYEYARDADLCLTYAIVSPQADRSKGTSEQAEEFLPCGICDQDNTGITLRGAKMLTTAAPLANELMVGSIQPLGPGEEKYAFTAIVPLNAPGLKLLSRRSYEASAQSQFDQPLASRFDENDCVVYFDEVKVPWERVFVHGSVKMSMDQWYATPTHVYQNYQCQIRLMVKLRFLVGLARKIAETNGIIQFPPVRETLGQLAAQTAMVESFVVGMEAAGSNYGKYWVPNASMLYSAQVLTQQLYPEFTRTIRELAGGGLIMLPSSAADLTSEATYSMVTHVQRSSVASPVERIKLMKVAWDAVGSEFASRHIQYEMFYAGAPMVTRNHAFRTFDWDTSRRLVEGFMTSYEAPARPAPASGSHGTSTKATVAAATRMPAPSTAGV
jgi:4-hydroxyphenylacetate 3-monooxygenase